MENFRIENQKEFMARLLTGNDFDTFLLKEAQIKTANTYTIDGYEQKAFYGSDKDMVDLASPYEYAPWERMKSVVLSLIKGKLTPLSMKIVLYLKPELTEELLGDSGYPVDYLIINFSQGESGMSITTAVAYKEFTLDKEPEQIWDRYIRGIL